MSVQHVHRIFGGVDGTPGRLFLFHVDYLSETPSWNDVEPSVRYLTEKGVQIDVKCFDHFSNLRKCCGRLQQ